MSDTGTARTADGWGLTAEDYRDVPCLMFEVCNEPDCQYRYPHCFWCLVPVRLHR